MNTTKSVYNRLFSEDKVELGKHEVELASLQKVNALDDAALNFRDKTRTAHNKAKDALGNLSNLLNQSINNFNKVVTEVDELEKSAKDLGISLPNEARLARDSAKREISQATELKNKVSSIKL